MYSSNGVGIWNSTQLHYTGGIPQFCGVNAVELELHNVFYKHVRTFVNVLATYTVELELHWSSTMFFRSAYIRMYCAYINVLKYAVELLELHSRSSTNQSWSQVQSRYRQ